MRLTGLSSLGALFCALTVTVTATATVDYPELPLDCLDTEAHGEAWNRSCHAPLSGTSMVLPGKFWFAKLPCLDCPIVREVKAGKTVIGQAENDLMFNLSLSHDRTTLLMNSRPIFPSLTIDPATAIYAEQVNPDFNGIDRDTALECSLKHCGPGGDRLVAGRCWCLDKDRIFSAVNLDFDYSAVQSETRNDELTWVITFDAIGGLDGHSDPAWVFNRTNQQMLQIFLSGTPIDKEDQVPQVQAASTLFGEPVEEPEQRFRLAIEDVKLVTPRSYTFPSPPKLGFWGKLRHFFGYDPRGKDGHIVYLHDEWAEYGRKGTLKDKLGRLLYGIPWIRIVIVVGSILTGLLAILGLYRLICMVKQQSDLASWKGMDEVWEQLRRDREEDEEEGLLHEQERYRDDPTPRLSGEPFRHKPLPSKPLPEKPLPAVPLVDT